MIIQIEISDKSIELLKQIKKVGVIEFRDSEYQSLEQFKNSEEFSTDEFGLGTEKWFKKRNFCDLKDLDELIELGLLQDVDMSWHMSYQVSKFGEDVLKKSNH